MKVLPNALQSMVRKPVSVFQLIEPKTNSGRTPKTTASSLKFEVDALVEKLGKTVSITDKHVTHSSNNL